MGFYDDLKNISREAKNKAKNIKEKLDEEFSDNELYTEAKNVTNSTVEQGKSLSKSLTDGASELQQEFGKTDVGKAVGDISRSISAKLANLPIFSLTTDTVKEKNGVEKLYKHLNKDPNDPIRYIWLAEALIRTRLDMLHYSRIRSTVDPSYYMVKTSVQAMNSLGEVEKDPVTTKLLKKSFVLSLDQLNKNTRNHKALYCLARIYFCQGDIPEAIKYSKLSFLARINALSLITLGKCYLSIGQIHNAEKAAKKAIAYKSTYGYKILAECVMLGEADGGSFSKIEKFSALNDRIRHRHKEAYLGPSGDTLGILEGVGKKQWNRLIKLVEE